MESMTCKTQGRCISWSPASCSVTYDEALSAQPKPQHGTVTPGSGCEIYYRTRKTCVFHQYSILHVKVLSSLRMKCNRAQMCFIWCRWKKGVDMSLASANHISCNWAAGHQSPSVFCHRSKERISDQKPDLTKDQKTHVHAVKTNFWQPCLILLILQQHSSTRTFLRATNPTNKKIASTVWLHRFSAFPASASKSMREALE